MSQIPQNVWDAADKAHYDGYVSKDTRIQVDFIAKAILAERERCCKVAAHFAGSLWTPEQNIVAQMILDNLRDGA